MLTDVFNNSISEEFEELFSDSQTKWVCTMVSNAQSHIIWHIILPHHQLHSFAHMQLHPKLLAETISATSSLNNTTSAAQKRTILTINQFAAPLNLATTNIIKHRR